MAVDLARIFTDEEGFDGGFEDGWEDHPFCFSDPSNVFVGADLEEQSSVRESCRVETSDFHGGFWESVVDVAS